MNKQFQIMGAKMPGALLKGALAAVALWIVGALVTAGLIGGEVIACEHVGYAIVLILLISSFTAAKITISKSEGNNLLMAAITAFVVVLILLFGNWVIGAERVNGLLQTLLVVVSGVASALMIAGKKKGKRHKRKF